MEILLVKNAVWALMYASFLIAMNPEFVLGIVFGFAVAVVAIGFVAKSTHWSM